MPEDPTRHDSPRNGTFGEMQELLRRIGRFEGEVKALEAQLASLEAADEHRRAELVRAHQESADAQAAARESQARVDESRRLIAHLQERLEAAEEARARAEDERTAVIAALGWRARRRLQREREEP